MTKRSYEPESGVTAFREMELLLTTLRERSYCRDREGFNTMTNYAELSNTDDYAQAYVSIYCGIKKD